ncbi:MAG: DNA adenine methylase [Kiritimatiellia bacterium]
MSTTSTPLRYPGGKTAYAGLLSKVIELNKLDDVVLVEPYAGGAGASIKLLLEGTVSHLILNDLDPSIYAFWWSVVNASEKLVDLIIRTPLTIDEWKRQREISRRKDVADLLALGFATLYMNRCNRSGILSANPIGGIKQTGTYKIDARFNKQGIVEKIKDIAEMASYIEIRNSSCERLLSGLKRRKDTSNLLVYLDPPYFQKGPSLYMNHYGDKDHEKLAKLVLSCDFNWILSYDCHEKIRKLYAGVPMYTSNLRYTIIGNVEASELVATRLKVPNSLKRIVQR